MSVRSQNKVTYIRLFVLDQKKGLNYKIVWVSIGKGVDKKSGSVRSRFVYCCAKFYID